MYISSINLKKFRNYDNLNIDFSSNINFIEGDNGSGKSNILEAISILSNIKSFRNSSDGDIYKWGGANYYCAATVNKSDYGKFEIGSAFLNNKIKKKYKIDDVEIKKTSDYYGKLLTVSFSPDDISLINYSPEIRRKYFDAVISKLDNYYFTELSQFKKILVSRNKLLKRLNETRSGDYRELEIWDRLFAEKSCKIISKRDFFIKEFSEVFINEYGNISRKEDSPLLEYSSKLKVKSEDDIYDELEKRRKLDIIKKTTGIGPQRDDYIFRNKDNKFVNYASQGQKRTASIALKISEKKYIENITGKKVILLIDDILSELDYHRKHNLLETIDNNNQVIFTMVSSSSLNLDKFNNVKIFKIDSGKIINEIQV